jgi:hypothetical protein
VGSVQRRILAIHVGRVGFLHVGRAPTRLMCAAEHAQTLFVAVELAESQHLAQQLWR